MKSIKVGYNFANIPRLVSPYIKYIVIWHTLLSSIIIEPTNNSCKYCFYSISVNSYRNHAAKIDPTFCV